MRYIYFTLLCFLLFSEISRGQNPGELDLSFNPNGINTGTGANQFVHASVRQPDGKIISVGNFTAYNGSARNRIIRINPDGTLDPTFNIGTGANATIWTVALQSDGKILIGGEFTQFNGVSSNRIARLNSDGSVDSNFNIGSGFNARVYSIFIQSNGKILVGGDFSGFNGASRPFSARLETIGLLDPSYVPGYSGGPVISIVSTSDGSIYLAGGFAFNIVKLTSTGNLINGWCQCGVSGIVMALHVQDDDKLLVGGRFTSNGPAGTRNDLIRINPNGTIDTSFFFSGLGINNYILSISPQSGGKIFIAGNFQTQRWNVARLNSNGSLDNTFNAGVINMPIWNVLALPDGKAVIGGEFTSVNGNARNYLAQLNADGTYEVMGAGANGTVGSISLLQDGKILIGGFFTTYNGISRPYFRRLNADGTLDSSFNLGQAGPNSSIYAISIQTDGKIIIIGGFTTYNGVSRNKIARLNPDGSLDVSFNPGTGVSGDLFAFSQQADGKIIIVGDFTSYNGISRNRIARLNLDGSLDGSFNPVGPDSFISNLEAQSDGKFLIAGYFTSYNGVSRNWIARLNSDGSLDASFNPGTSTNYPVHTIKQMSDGKILIVGDFTTFNGVSRNRIARLNSNGSLDTSFNIGTGANQRVFRIGLQGDGKILIGGGFTSYNGALINRIARLNTDGSLDSSFNPGTGANEQINAIVNQTDGKILLGGVFTSYNNINRSRIIRIYGDQIIEEDTEAPVLTVENLTPFATQCLVNFSDLTIPTATDNVDGTIQGITNHSIFPITQQGSYTITWTFTDAAGNSSTQDQTIIIDDTTAPVPAIAQLPVVSGQCSVTVTTPPTANDVCKGLITGTTTDPLTYEVQGNYTITWTYDDGNGNTSTQTQTVIVDDTTAPVPAVAELPTISGQCAVEVSAPKANDACEGEITGTTTDTISYTEQGTYTITWTYDDGNGNTSTQTQTVIVDDTTAPVPALAQLPVVSGQCSVTVTTPPAANDVCKGLITGTTTDPLTYEVQGTYTITWTYDDGNGNTSTQTQTAIVDDTTSPVPTLAQLPVVSGQCAVEVTAPKATDACEGEITGTTTDPLTYDEQGTYTITWTYDDGNGNTTTQTQTVIVDDTTAPVPTLSSLPVISGQCAVTVTAPTAIDACEGEITGTTTDPLTYDAQGTYTITWTYDDGNGNITTQEQTVIVDDTTAPVPTLAQLPVISGQCAVEVSAPKATDACEGEITGTTTDPLTYDAQGTYTITWTYDDGNGNISTQTQTVVVDDTTAPVPALAQLAVVSGQCAVEVSAPKAIDACEGEITGTTTDPLTYDSQGTYTITWTYDDGNGNITTQEQTVIVDDTAAPVPTLAQLPVISGQCAVEVSAPKATDACEGEITGTTTDPLTYDAQGTYTITWTYDDGNGNTSTQTQTVIVDDTTAPVPAVAELPIVSGQCSVTVTAPTANDACAGTITGTTIDPLTYDAQGTYTITWTYDDGNGNTSTQTQTVIVDDTTAPVPAVAELPVISGQCSVTVTAPTANDACEGEITGTTNDPLTYDAQGTYTITWTYDDGNGNTSTQTQTVIVDDTTAPVPAVAQLPVVSGQCSATVTAPTANDACEGTITGTTTDPLTYDAQGTYTITWTYDDGNGNISTQVQTVIVSDVTNPTWSTTVGSLNRTVYCGQNNLLAQAQLLSPIANDNCSVIEVKKTGGVLVPSGPNGAGTITNTWVAFDVAGNESEVFTQVITVEGIQVDASASSTPVRLGTAAILSASVLPAKSDVTVKFYLDGNLVGSDETDGSGLATVSVSGLALDVYKVTAVVGDGCAESEAYLPVYDPNGNFVTGGGWINSPEGALIGTTTVGKANFGFVSKYKKGSNQVDGNTEFQFSAGNLSFKSTLHEAGTLVISGRKATYRGDGTVNGVSGYKFTITAIDGHWNGGTAPDEFRIKIWGSNGVLYDNGLGADDNSDIATSLGGGSIVIHESKARGTKRVSTELITVDWNTPLEEVKKQVDEMSKAWFESRKLALILDASTYDPLTPGFYELKADLVENEFFELDEPISIQVLVQDKPKALDIELSGTTVPNQPKAGDQIALLSTVDPIDDIHTYSVGENSNLTVEGNKLIWKGGGVPAAQMKVTVFSTDRAGQTISKEVTLTRDMLHNEFLLYPNPAESETNVLVQLNEGAIVGIQLFAAAGRLIVNESSFQEETFVKTFNLDGLAPGMYTVQVKIGWLVMTKRLIKR